LRSAAIDVGTNSVQLCVGELESDGNVRILLDSTVNARLGKGFAETSELQSDAMDRGVEAIRECLDAARTLNVENTRVVGTSAVRESSNGGVFIDRVYRELGVRIEKLGSRDEGRLAYNAIALDTKLGSFDGSQAILDIGGGSTELILGVGPKLTSITSLRIGATRLTDRYLKGNDVNICRLVDAAVATEWQMRRVVTHVEIDRMVGVGGSVVNLARVWKAVPVSQTDEVHGVNMSFCNVRQVLDLLYSKTSEERRQVIGLEPERVDSVLAGAIILERSMAILEREEMIISTRGLRHGVLYEMLGIKTQPQRVGA